MLKLLFPKIGPDKPLESGCSHSPNLLSRLGREHDPIATVKADRDAYTGIKAYYYEVNSAEKKEAIAGGGENRHGYTDQASALQAARAERNRLQRGSATLSHTLARGRPDLILDQTYSLTGIKAEIAAIIWLGGNLRHSFAPESLTTTLELESQLPDGDEGTYAGLTWYRDEKTGQQHKLTEGDQTGPDGGA